jgi:hypothetical protein
MCAINGIYNSPQLKMRVLFVSTYFPPERVFVNGPFKRMRIFIDAIKEIASLDVLFFVPPNIDVSPSSVSDFESDFSKQWNAKISLFMYPRFQHQWRDSIWRARWQRYGASVLSFFSQEYMASQVGLNRSRRLRAYLIENQMQYLYTGLLLCAHLCLHARDFQRYFLILTT